MYYFSQMANVHTKEILTRPEKVGKMAAIMSVFVRMDKQENTDVLTSRCPEMRRVQFLAIRKISKEKLYAQGVKYMNAGEYSLDLGLID